MTMTTDAWPVATTSATRAAPSRRMPIAAVAIAAATLSFLSLGGMVLSVWRDGAFIDTDDAMRLVQVRALLAGQTWFDMTARALDPPHGVFMHWSRTVDVPVAALIRLFGLVADPTTAERLARLAFPFALLVGLFLGVARLAELLVGPEARLPAVLATLLSGNGIIQFLPGRIDHHAPQILILVAMLTAALTSLAPAKARHATWAAALAALSLSISLENLPFILGLSAMLVLVWVRHGAPAAPMLRAYCLGLGIGLPLLFVATVAPPRYLLPVCDAYGAAHLGAGLVATLGCGLAAGATETLATRGRRLLAATLVAALALAFVAAVFPDCLHDPFWQVDPLVRRVWLDRVEESLSLGRLLAHEPDVAWPGLVPVVMGLAACLVACRRTHGVTRERFAVVSGIVAIGLAMAFWQVRVFTSVTAIALCGGLWVAVAALRAARGHGHQGLAALPLLVVVPFTASATTAVRSAFHLAAPPPATESPAAAAPTADGLDCLAPQALAPLRALGAGRAVAPIDSGSYLLADTHLTVFAAAFHRDGDGLRYAIDVWSAPPATARALLAARGAVYVMTCPSAGDLRFVARRAPDGLAAALLAHRPPAWLSPVALRGTPYAVYRVMR